MDTIIAGFGEVMLRLSPAGKLRFGQVLPGTLDAAFGKRAESCFATSS